MDDVSELTELNRRFIDAFRHGSWVELQPILSERFSYLDGATGQPWSRERYVQNLDGHPLPELAIDGLVIHVDGDVAVVSARSSRSPGRYARYLDTYERRAEGWRCVHACVWPVESSSQLSD
jgi:hypothetical protein